MYNFYIFLIIIITLLVLKFLIKLNIKVFMSILISIMIIGTIYIGVTKPKMHKLFNFNIIERVLKINSDGSTTIIETNTTNEVIKK